MVLFLFFNASSLSLFFSNLDNSISYLCNKKFCSSSTFSQSLLLLIFSQNPHWSFLEIKNPILNLVLKIHEYVENLQDETLLA